MIDLALVKRAVASRNYTLKCVVTHFPLQSMQFAQSFAQRKVRAETLFSLRISRFASVFRYSCRSGGCGSNPVGLAENLASNSLTKACRLLAGRTCLILTPLHSVCLQEIQSANNCGLISPGPERLGVGLRWLFSDGTYFAIRTAYQDACDRALSQRLVSEAWISAARRRACSSQSRSVALKKPTADW